MCLVTHGLNPADFLVALGEAWSRALKKTN